MGISRETQLRALKIMQETITHIKRRRDVFRFGNAVVKDRWMKLKAVVSLSDRFSLQSLSPEYCNYFGTIRDPSPGTWTSLSISPSIYLSIYLSICLSIIFLKLCVVMAAYAWVKCEREADGDCYNVLKDGMIISREGTLYGADNRHVRLSLIKSQDDFDQLLMRMRELSSPLKPSK